MLSESTEKSHPQFADRNSVMLQLIPFSPFASAISLNYCVLNQLLRRAHMAVSRGVIFPGSGVERYCYDYRFRTRSLDRSLILIIVTRNKAQLQNARVRARV